MKNYERKLTDNYNVFNMLKTEKDPFIFEFYSLYQNHLNLNHVVYFFSRQQGDAKICYGIKAYSTEYKENPYFYTKIDSEIKLCAIIVNDVVYVIDDFMFNIWGDFPEIQNVQNLYKAYNNFNLMVYNDFVMPFYGALEPYTNELKDNSYLINKARAYVLSLNNITDWITKLEKAPEIDLEIDDYINYLYNILDLEKFVNNKLLNRLQYFVDNKSCNTQLIYFINHPLEVCKQYELDIINGLKELNSYYSDIRNITVEFCFNNKTASTTISLHSLIRILLDKDYFSSYNFTNSKKGEELLKFLDCDYRSDNKLRCEHITKITYHKRIAYERKEV